MKEPGRRLQWEGVCEGVSSQNTILHRISWRYSGIQNQCQNGTPVHINHFKQGIF